jgi:hypothetical protein
MIEGNFSEFLNKAPSLATKRNSPISFLHSSVASEFSRVLLDLYTLKTIKRT